MQLKNDNQHEPPKHLSYDVLRRNSAMKQQSLNARNNYSRSHSNVGELHRRNK